MLLKGKEVHRISLSRGFSHSQLEGPPDSYVPSVPSVLGMRNPDLGARRRWEGPAQAVLFTSFT